MNFRRFNYSRTLELLCGDALRFAFRRPAFGVVQKYLHQNRDSHSGSREGNLSGGYLSSGPIGFFFRSISATAAEFNGELSSTAATLCALRS